MSADALPDDMWLAYGGEDGILRIWDVSNGQAKAMMRIDNTILSCAWLGSGGLAIGGPAGLYVFDFQANSTSVPVKGWKSGLL